MTGYETCLPGSKKKKKKKKRTESKENRNAFLGQCGVNLLGLKSKIHIRVFCGQIKHKLTKQREETIIRKPD